MNENAMILSVFENRLMSRLSRTHHANKFSRWAVKSISAQCFFYRATLYKRSIYDSYLRPSVILMCYVEMNEIIVKLFTAC